MKLLSPAQCRAARALLDWSQPVLAEKCGLHVQTISNFEKEAKTPSKRTLETIASALEAAGTEFTNNDGVQRKTNSVLTLTGQEGFVQFAWDVYETVKKYGGEICVSNVNELEYISKLPENVDQVYIDRMQALKKTKPYLFKILVKEGDYNFSGSRYAEYRWTPKKLFGRVPFYVYGPKLAFLFFEEETTVHIIENAQIADSQRLQFNLLWDQAIIPDDPNRKPSSP